MLEVEEYWEVSLLYLILKDLGICPPSHVDCDQSMVMLVLLISKADGRLGRGGKPFNNKKKTIYQEDICNKINAINI